MAAAITVTAEFAADFKYLLARAGYDRQEEMSLRDQVRSDFENVGKWVTETVRLYQFADETWMRLPRPEWCEGYLLSMGWAPMDPTIFQRLGILAQVKLCYQVREQQKALG